MYVRDLSLKRRVEVEALVVWIERIFEQSSDCMVLLVDLAPLVLSNHHDGRVGLWVKVDHKHLFCITPDRKSAIATVVVVLPTPPFKFIVENT